ncbi:hypothetical protein AGLY_013231 [Aphis glycines]|uniref:Uncharacterized protein n=1 Tax=Aphis glycines TaxID=307491 RepID=A0A6G0T6K2_APHGL|nr:hypothetical protein AGLY_013231 [Aphis glycines]
MTTLILGILNINMPYVCFVSIGMRRYVTRTPIHFGRATSRKADAEDQSGEEAQMLVSLHHRVLRSDHVPRVRGHREPHAYQGTKNVRLSMMTSRSNSCLSNNMKLLTNYKIYQTIMLINRYVITYLFTECQSNVVKPKPGTIIKSKPPKHQTKRFYYSKIFWVPFNKVPVVNASSRTSSSAGCDIFHLVFGKLLIIIFDCSLISLAVISDSFFFKLTRKFVLALFTSSIICPVINKT